jgi:hypothetical protein
MFRELRKISKVLTLTNSVVIEKELSKIATSKERKQMWVLIDGKRLLGDIATAVKMTPQAVGQFLIGGAALESHRIPTRETTSETFGLRASGVARPC